MSMFDGFLGGAPKPEPKPEKGVQLHGKQIGGVYYVRADDVVALLEINDVLPKARGLIKTRVTST